MMKKLCLITWVLMSAGLARADLYQVSGIPISAELNSAKEARTAAIENGETDAFWALIKKMVAPEYQQQISMPADTDIRAWVQTVSLANEKNTATKYMADLSVRFDEKKVQNFLTQNNVPYLTKDLPDMVVVPVFQKGGSRHTLEEGNPLFAYLTKNPPENDLWKAIVPTGDLEEIMSVQEALNNENRGALTNLGHKYGVQSVMVVQVTQQGPYVMANVSYIPEQPNLNNRVDVMEPGGKLDAVIPDLWRKIVEEQEHKWRETKTQNFESKMTFWVQVPIQKLSEWTALRQKLLKADFIENFSVRGFRPNEVWISFGFKGTSTDLNQQLKPFGVALMVENQSGFWVLKSWGGYE